MKNITRLIKYVKIFNFFFNTIFLATTVFYIVMKNRIQNELILILCFSVIVLIEKIVFRYWINSAHSFVFLDDNIVFLCGNKERNFSKSDCILIQEKYSCYIFYFSNKNKVVLRKLASNLEYKNNAEINSLNFPYSKIIWYR